MKFLKILGWLFVPYILIFFFWKNVKTSLRVMACIWAFIILLGTIGNLNSGEDKPLAQTVTNVEISTVEETKAPKATEDPAIDKKAKEKAKADAIAKEKADAIEKAPHLGEATSIGKLTVGIGKDIKITPSVGSEYISQEAQGVYWVFSVGIKNGDKAARMIDTSMFQLVSDDEIKYEPDSMASLYVNDPGNFMMQNINPGIQSNGFIVFDMPKEAKDKMASFKLKVDSGVGFKAGTSADFILKSR